MNKTKKKGFTIVELIVVMAVIGILVLLAMPKFMSYTNKAKITKVINDIKVIENSSELYYMDNNDWPKLSDTALTTSELESYAQAFYDNTGVTVTLDPNGIYYLVDYHKLNPYMKTSNIEGVYVLQSTFGKVYYASKFTDEGKIKFGDSAKDVLDGNTPSKDVVPPVISNITVIDKTVTITATDNKGGEIQYLIKKENTQPSKGDDWSSENVITVPDFDTYYVFAKDKSDNISEASDVKVTDDAKPIINSVSVSDKTITISATDNGVISGYAISSVDSNVDLTWRDTNVITTPGYGTYYVFVKDNVGNISDSYEVIVADNEVPVINSVTVNDKELTIIATDNDDNLVFGISLINNKDGVTSYQGSNKITVPEYGTYYVFAKDSFGNVSLGKQVATADTIVPIIESVKVEERTITITASDNVGVSKYGISTTNNGNNVANWMDSNIITVPSYGNYYVFAKDASGNISEGKATTTVDAIKPTISSVSAADKIITIIATDNVGIAGYGLSITNNSSGVSSWSTNNVLTAPGYANYYVFVKDAAGNISDSKSVTTADGVKPTISSVTASDKVVTISATDNVGVTGYGISSTNSSSGVSNWGTSNVITAPGYGTYYVFVKDARGNISDSKSITTIDLIKPVIASVELSRQNGTDVFKLTTVDSGEVVTYGYSLTEDKSSVTWVGQSNYMPIPGYGDFYMYAKDSSNNISDGYWINYDRDGTLVH